MIKKICILIMAILLPSSFSSADSTEEPVDNLSETVDIADEPKTIEEKTNPILEVLDAVKSMEESVRILSIRVDMVNRKLDQALMAQQYFNEIGINEELKTLREKLEFIPHAEDEFGNIASRLDEVELNLGKELQRVNDAKEADKEVIKKEMNLIKKRLATFNVSNKKYNDLESRMESLEERNENAFGTMDVLKEATAELRKDLEDQQIATELVKKDLKKSVKPEKAEDKSLEAQINVISEMVVKHDKQLADVADVADKHVADKHVADKHVADKHVADKHGTDDPKQKEFLYGEQLTLKEYLDMTSDNEPLDGQEIKKEDEEFNIFDSQGYKNLGGGFYANDIKFAPFGSSVEFSGEILNASGEDYNMADFKIFLYDHNDILLWDQEFSIIGIVSGGSREFHEILTGVSIKNINKYGCAFGKNTMPEKLISLDLNNELNEEQIIEPQNAEEINSISNTTEEEIMEPF